MENENFKINIQLTILLECVGVYYGCGHHLTIGALRDNRLTKIS
jgi:hypothetical protein